MVRRIGGLLGTVITLSLAKELAKKAMKVAKVSEPKRMKKKIDLNEPLA